jgi:hypothetical protein
MDFEGFSTCDRQGSSPTLTLMERLNPEVEHLLERIGELVRQRQDLRARGADRGLLEGNRVELARSQAELGRALIDRVLAQP